MIGHFRLHRAGNVLQHGQHGNNVERPLVRKVLGKTAAHEMTSPFAMGQGDVRIDAHIFPDIWNLLKESAVGAANIKDAGATCQIWPDLLDPPFLYQPVEPCHRCLRHQIPEKG